MLPVEQLVFEEDDGILGADRGLQQPLRIGGAVGRNNNEPRNACVPGPVILTVLSGYACCCAVRTAEDHRAAHLATGHVVGLGGRVHDMVDRLHREVEGHELDDRAEAAHRRARAKPGEAIFGDRRIDDALCSELVEQSLRDLVSALVLGDLLAHHEHAVIAAHFLGHRVAQRFPDR